MPCLFLVLCMFTCYRPVLILVPFAVTHSYHGQTYIQCFYTSCSSLWCATPLCSTLKQRKAGPKRWNINSSPMDHEGKRRIYTYNRHSIELHANSNIIRHPSTENAYLSLTIPLQWAKKLMELHCIGHFHITSGCKTNIT